MQRAADLDLHTLTMDQDAFAANPLPHFTQARTQHPWLARWTLGYVVTDYKAMRDLFVIEDKMRPMYDEIVQIMGGEGTAWGNFQKGHMLNQSGATHRRIRDVLAPSFTPRQANKHRPLMREVIVQLLDEWAPKQAFDFEEFASYFPITVMCKLIGASPDVIPALRSAMEAIGRTTSMDKQWLPEMLKGVDTMEVFVDRLLTQRRTEDRTSKEPDLLDLLLTTQASGGLSDREIRDTLIFLFVAGYDTSKNMLTLTMKVLIDHPEIYQRLAADDSYARQVVKEAFRYHSVISTSRALTDDIVYRDVLLEKDTMLWIPFSIATNDPLYADDPEVFDPERPRKHPSIGFGLGAHICLGQYIARAQIEEGLHLIAKRLLNPRKTGPNSWRPFPGIWGVNGLPIEFDSALTQAAMSDRLSPSTEAAHPN